MGFVKGHKKIGGRSKGTGNKGLSATEIAEEMGVNPIRILGYFALGDWKGAGFPSATYAKLYGKEFIEEMYITPTLMQKSAAELAQYMFAKLKAIEHSGSIDSNVESKTQLIISLPDNGRSAKGN